MIRYTLACDAGHDFESWFPSSASYDDQAARDLVTCPICGSPRVGKALMAPSIARTDQGRGVRAPLQEAALGEPERRLRAFLRAVREQATRDADDVGPRFVEEARAIHYGDAPPRAIYGEASADEARALLDEGIDVAPLPPAPGERH